MDSRLNRTRGLQPEGAHAGRVRRGLCDHADVDGEVGPLSACAATGDGGAVKLTISLYYLPKGESIDGKGITPDVVVAVKGDPAKEDTAQMDMAKHVLQNMIDGKPPTSLLLEDLKIAA